MNKNPDLVFYNYLKPIMILFEKEGAHPLATHYKTHVTKRKKTKAHAG